MKLNFPKLDASHKRALALLIIGLVEAVVAAYFNIPEGASVGTIVAGASFTYLVAHKADIADIVSALDSQTTDTQPATPPTK